MVIINSGVLAPENHWANQFREATASRDGGYVAVVYGNRQYPAYSQVDVVEVATGKVKGRLAGNNLKSPIWSSDGGVLNLLSEQFFFADSLIRLSSDGHILQRIKAPMLSKYTRVRSMDQDIQLVVDGWSSRTLFTTGDKSGGLQMISVSRLTDPYPLPATPFKAALWNDNFGNRIFSNGREQVLYSRAGEANRILWPAP